MRDAWLCRPVPLLLVLLFVFWIFGFSSGPNGVLTKGTPCFWTRPGLEELPNREMYVFNQKKSSYIFFQPCILIRFAHDNDDRLNTIHWPCFVWIP